MGIRNICIEVDKNFKETGSLGIDKIIETDNAWIFTRKEEDDNAVYGNYAVVVFKDSEDNALLLMPELYTNVGKTIKETVYKAS